MNALQKIIEKIQSPAKSKFVGSIGLEFALRELHLVQLQKNASGKITCRAKAALEYPVPREELFSSTALMKKFLQDAIRSAPFSGRYVAMAMLPSDVKLISVSYKIAKDQDAAQAILDSMSNRLEGDLDDYVIDYLPARVNSADGDCLAIVASAKREVIISYLELIRKSGFKVKTLEIGPSAIKRLVGATSAPNCFDNILVINFGQKKSFLTLISCDRLLLDLEINLGELDMLSEISAALDMSQNEASSLITRYGLSTSTKNSKLSNADEDSEISETISEIVKPGFIKLVQDIDRALIYAASETRGESVKKILLMGGIARWQGVDELINELVAIEVVIPDPLEAFSDNSYFENDPLRKKIPDLAVATGLALRGIVAHD